jgi:hypothetical protein
VFYILKNVENKYGVKKQSLFERLMAHNPFGNLKSHSITSMNMLQTLKDGFKTRILELQEKKSGMD